MNENDGSTARGFDPDTAPDLSTDGWPERFAKASVRRGRPPEGAVESIHHQSVVAGRHRPFSSWRARLADTDRPRSARLDQAARRRISRPSSRVLLSQRTGRGPAENARPWAAGNVEPSLGSLRKTSSPTCFLVLYSPTAQLVLLLFAICFLIYLLLLFAMRKPSKPERLYVDFDGFFAACEEQADPLLFGRPVGVIPFRDARNSCVIASNAKAKRFGVKTGVAIAEARRLCPQIALVPQRPDLYVRTQQRVVVAVLSVLPIDVICSIDELAAVLGKRDCPEEIAGRIKQHVREAVGEHITCSIGCAPNRWLAKIAADLDKPDGLTVLGPSDLPGPLLNIELEELPGVGRLMRARLEQAGLSTVKDLWNSDPGRLCSIWGNVAGARFWYALHGYDVEPPPTRRSSIGHGRVLPPEQRSVQTAREPARQLVVKAARRLRREGFVAQRLTVSADCLGAPRWTASTAIAKANDDLSCLGALAVLWAELDGARPHATLFRIAVSFDRFMPSGEVQLELPFGEPDNRQQMAGLSAAIDTINGRYGRIVVGYGQCGAQDGYTGAKIAYGRIPEWEDFW